MLQFEVFHANWLVDLMTKACIANIYRCTTWNQDEQHLIHEKDNLQGKRGGGPKLKNLDRKMKSKR